MKLLLIVLAAALVASFVSLAFILRSGGGTMAVQFLGYTNNTAGQLQGAFLITNRGTCDMEIGVLPFQIQTGTSWKSSDRHLYFVVTSVDAHDSTVLLRPAPSESVTWRLPVSYWSQKTHTIRYRLNKLLNRLHLIDGDHHFCPTVVSPPVHPKPLRPQDGAYHASGAGPLLRIVSCDL
jgi:hypothetical protein